MRIRCHHICPTYLDQSTIDRSEIWDRSIELDPSSGTIVWGPSGRGKSTFLRILYGLERRFTGSLTLGDSSPADWPFIREQNIAFVSQDFHLFEEESGWNNLGYLPARHPSVSDSTIGQWSEVLGIPQVLDRSPSSWSQGQKQRFCLLRALASPFRWILLDEPVSHLDPDSASKSMDLLLSVCEERRAGWVIAQQTADSELQSGQTLQA